MLPRQFLVRAILQGLKRNPNIPIDILSSRIADSVEAAAEIFESNDDALPVSDFERDRILGGRAPQSPEDLGHETIAHDKPLVRLPQPEPTKNLLISPDSPEANELMSNAGHVTPIRPQRNGQPSGTHERPNWDFNHLYATIMGAAPMSIKVTPDGQSGEVELERTFQANAATGIVKLVYCLPLQQKESSPSSPGGDATAMSIPIDVGKSFSIFDPLALDFDREIYDIKEIAKRSFKTRATSVPSVTPIIPNRTLDQVFSEALRANAGDAPSPRSAFSGSFDSV
jgi:hypothetical protein